MGNARNDKFNTELSENIKFTGIYHVAPKISCIYKRTHSDTQWKIKRGRP